MAPTVDAIPPLRNGRRGRPRQRPDKLHADKAYDAKRGVGSAGHAGSDRGLPGAVSRGVTGSGGIAGWSSAAMPSSTVPAAFPSAMSGAPTSTRPSPSCRPASSPSARSGGSVRRSKSPHSSRPPLGGDCVAGREVHPETSRLFLPQTTGPPRRAASLEPTGRTPTTCGRS